MDDVIDNAEQAIATAQQVMATNSNITRRNRTRIFSRDKGLKSPKMDEAAIQLEDYHGAVLSELYRVRQISQHTEKPPKMDTQPTFGNVAELADVKLHKLGMLIGIPLIYIF
jgi:hypothetical protein